MQIGLKVDLDPVVKYLTFIERENLPFVTAIALTGAMKQARKSIIAEMRSKFDRPKPQTVDEERGPLFIKSADYRKLRAGVNDYAEVRVKDRSQGGKSDPAIAWLSHNIYGGGRIEKRSENLMRRAGVLPLGYFAVPGSSAKLDRYGNMSAGQVQQILAKLMANRDTWQNSHKQSRSKVVQDYFLVNRFRAQTKHFPVEGVWQRTAKGSVQPVLIFTRRVPQYRARIRFHEIAEARSRAAYLELFYPAMQAAINRSRGLSTRQSVA